MQFFVVILFLLFAAPAFSAECKSTHVIDLEKFSSVIGDRKVAFIARDLKSDACWLTNKDKINERFSPWSTFKIPHFLIALETGALSSADDAIRWNPATRPAEDYWPETWARDQTLGSAFKHSAAWAFQELVPKIGVSNYQRWLKRFSYGNRALADGQDDFWLRRPLLISPQEQVDFLACLAISGCGVAPAYVKALEAVAMDGENTGFILYGKTGAGPEKSGDFKGKFQGWYVGYIRDLHGKPSAAFAIHMQSIGFDSLRTFRREMALELLTHTGFWPEAKPR